MWDLYKGLLCTWYNHSFYIALRYNIYVLGSSSIWTCRILNICFDFFQLRLPVESNIKYLKFKIWRVQIDELPRTWDTYVLLFSLDRLLSRLNSFGPALSKRAINVHFLTKMSFRIEPTITICWLAIQFTQTWSR